MARRYTDHEKVRVARELDDGIMYKSTLEHLRNVTTCGYTRRYITKVLARANFPTGATPTGAQDDE